MEKKKKILIKEIYLMIGKDMKNTSTSQFSTLNSLTALW